MLPSHKVATEYKVGEREFVNVEDFLDSYPSVDTETRNKIKEKLEEVGGIIEKRIEVPFVKLLIDICLKSKSSFGSRQAPIALKEGWVIWTTEGHEPLIDALSYLHKPTPPQEYNSTDDRISMFTGELPIKPVVWSTDLLSEGYAWYISTEAPSTIFVSRLYIPTADDRNLFKVFKVEYVK